MGLLKVEHIAKNYEGLVVLSDVSVSVEKGEKVAIIGPNGAGKSTLFNVIGGQIPASGGNISYRGQDITRLASHRRLQLGLSRSYQINSLFFPLTVLENMMLAAKGASLPHFQLFRRISSRSDFYTEAKRLLLELNLWEKHTMVVANMSYGEQRLLEVAFGLASNPKLLMLDEPTAGLSTAEANNFGNKIKELLGDMALLFTAHDLDLVFNLADRILVLFSGKIIAEGSADEIQSNPMVKEIYLGGDTE